MQQSTIQESTSIHLSKHVYSLSIGGELVPLDNGEAVSVVSQSMVQLAIKEPMPQTYAITAPNPESFIFGVDGMTFNYRDEPTFVGYPFLLHVKDETFYIKTL